MADEEVGRMGVGSCGSGGGVHEPPLAVLVPFLDQTPM
jgi:hypothetical protein